MNSYRNTNDAYGMSGPFTAESKEALADEMAGTFKIWANGKADSEEILPEDVDEEIQSMRAEFIDGLEEVKMNSATDKNLGLIILDNGGGITLQMGDFGHNYEDADNAARDIAAWLGDSNTSDWNGNEADAVELDPTDEQVANGGYRRFRLDRGVDTLLSLAREVGACHWGNAEDLSTALRAKREAMRYEINSDSYTFLG